MLNWTYSKARSKAHRLFKSLKPHHLKVSWLEYATVDVTYLKNNSATQWIPWIWWKSCQFIIPWCMQPPKYSNGIGKSIKSSQVMDLNNQNQPPGPSLHWHFWHGWDREIFPLMQHSRYWLLSKADWSYRDMTGSFDISGIAKRVEVVDVAPLYMEGIYPMRVASLRWVQCTIDSLSESFHRVANTLLGSLSTVYLSVVQWQMYQIW